jgi:uncharacterized protein (TIGR03000 family)
MRLFGVAVLAAGLVGLAGASAQQPAGKVKSVIKVTVPNEKAELSIEGLQKETMKTTGTTREFESPELEGGKKFEYTFTVKFAPNNYTTITRTKTVVFNAGDAVVADLTKTQPDDKVVIRFVPTPKDIADEMMKLAKVGKDDVVADLGCGDGQLVLAGIRAGAKKGIGIDLDPKRIEEAKANAKAAKVEDKTEFKQGDALAVTAKDMADVTVVAIYMSDEFGATIKPKLLSVLKPGTRIVSHRFLLGDWKPEKSVPITSKEPGFEGYDTQMHLWTVPAAGKKDEPKKDEKKEDK